MKKFTFLFAFTISFVMAQSAILNVDKDPNRPSGYYGDLQLALNTAMAGDTIYLYPSNQTYGTVTVKKQVHIFGTGFDGLSSGSNSSISYLNLDSSTTVSGNPSGSSFQGLYISRLNCVKANIGNIVVAGNHISRITFSGYNCSGWLIINNYFTSYVSLNNNNSIIISNNIFQAATNAIQSSNSSSVIISHNMFFNWQYLSSVYNAIISDNIFICNSSAAASNYMANNVFYNNLSWRSILTPYNLPPAGNTGTGNISNQNPLFETGQTTSFIFSQDYHLQSTSPGKNAASDGTDIGIYGGSSPFVWGGIFSIPKITLTNITNPVINQSTPINVNVKAKKASL